METSYWKRDEVWFLHIYFSSKSIRITKPASLFSEFSLCTASSSAIFVRRRKFATGGQIDNSWTSSFTNDSPVDSPQMIHAEFLLYNLGTQETHLKSAPKPQDLEKTKLKRKLRRWQRFPPPPCATADRREPQDLARQIKEGSTAKWSWLYQALWIRRWHSGR